MIWAQFAITAAIIVFTATQMAKYGDAIALRTRLGRMFIGVLLIAGATSLPEVLTTLNSLSQGVPDLAAGNLLGSNLFNMFLLAVLDLVHQRRRILRRAALKHALTGSLSVLMIALVVFFILADVDIQMGWLGLDSLLIMLVYLVAIRLIQSNTLVDSPATPEEEIPPETHRLGRALAGFVIAAGVLVLVTPLMVCSSTQIAEITGLGTTFIGATLVAVVTSPPELVTTMAAARIGADDMAIGNLFGSNMFNMFALGLTGLFYTQGRYLAVIDPSFLLVGVLGLLMTCMALIGNLARFNRRFFFVEVDALALILMYFGGLFLLYTKGVASKLQCG